jgi:lysylphosphatidylglycerol synthetase-like protein (DUF2156 family)
VYLISTAQIKETSVQTMHKIIDAYPPDVYVITESRVVLTYLRMLIAPYNQNLDPAYPLYRSIANPEIVISISILLLFVITAVVLLCKNKRCLRNDLMGFCIIFALLVLSVSSLFPLPDLMAEHRSYLFSLPVITALMCRIDLIRAHLTQRSMYRVAGVLCFLVIVYSALTIKRNIQYSSRTSMWEDSVTKSPEKWRPNYNAGWAAVDEHQYEKALFYLKDQSRLTQ